MYAVVDIETTGSNSQFGRIIEIAVVVTDGERVQERYSSLVNPEVQVPGWITGLTGITNEMLSTAPLFSDICEEIFDLIKDKIFVAHNVSFDYDFLKAEFERENIRLNLKKLCTVRLSRKVFKGNRSYSLGNICSYLGISIQDRHRALGDANATAILLHRILRNDIENEVGKALKRNSGEWILPPNLDKQTVENLPQATGIYYFHNQYGKIIYIGKADNIRQRVKGHFNAKSLSREKQNLFSNIFDVSSEICGSELIALIREDQEIKKHWPEFNKESKRRIHNYGVYQYEDQNGLIRLNIGKSNPGQNPVMYHKSYLAAREWVLELAEKGKLCKKLCGLSKINCLECQISCSERSNPENHNLRLLKSLEQEKESTSFIILSKGRTFEERSFVVIINGSVKGYGFYLAENSISGWDDILQYLKPVKDNPDIQKIISGWLRKANKREIMALNPKDFNNVNSSYDSFPV